MNYRLLNESLFEYGEITLTVLDHNGWKSRELDSTVGLRSIFDRAIVFTDENSLLSYIKSSKTRHNSIIICLSNYNDKFLSQIGQHEAIHSIFIMNSSKKIDKSLLTKSDSSKSVHVFDQPLSLVSKLQEIADEVIDQSERCITNHISTLNPKEKTLRDLQNEIGPFLWRQTFKTILKLMFNEFDARQELIDYCRDECGNNDVQLKIIDKFQNQYQVENSIYWYTKSSFLYRTLNKALRSGDVYGLYRFRYLIKGLSASLEHEQKKQNITCVYRGGIICKNEIQDYRSGCFVATNGYFSTSTDLSVALAFISFDNDTGKCPSNDNKTTEYVLFYVDLDQNDSLRTIYADISDQSVYPDEKEVLFDIGTTFEITSIVYDAQKCYWSVRMKLSSYAIQLNQQYDSYIKQRIQETKPTLLFGILLTDMGQYEQAEKYFQHIASKMDDAHPDLANLNYSLARIHRFHKDYQKALDFFFSAKASQERNLPDSSFDLARTLAGIATVYYELHDYQQEFNYYEESLKIYQDILPLDHIEMARTYNRLGFACIHQENYQTALEHLNRSLTIHENVVPDTHPGYAQVLHNMGIVYYRLGEMEKAIHYCSRSFEIRKGSLPAEHFNLTESYLQLISLYEELGKFESAIDCVQQIQIHQANILATNHELRDRIDQTMRRLTNKS